MLPFLATAAEWILPYILWEGGAWGAKKVAGTLAKGAIKDLAEGPIAAQLAERVAGKVGSSAIGTAVTKAAEKLPEKVGKHLTAQEISRMAVMGGAGLGTLVAGQTAADSLGAMLSRREGAQHVDLVSSMPNGDLVRQQQQVAAQVKRDQMQEALRQYLGDADMAEQVMNGGSSYGRVV